MFLMFTMIPGEDEPILTSKFSKGLVQPLTGKVNHQKFNSSHLKMDGWNTRFHFGMAFLRCYVNSGRVHPRN